MRIQGIKVTLLLVMSGVFIAGAILSYDSHPAATSLWLPLSFLGGVFLILTLLLAVQLAANFLEGSEVSDELKNEDEN